MKLKRLLIRNFLSIGDKGIEIIFPEGSGITILKGINKDVITKELTSNGAGKSAIVEAILYAIYDETLRKAKKKAFLINSKTGKNCYIELEFDNCLIIRGLKPNILKFFVDGVEKTVNSSIAKTKELILKQVKVDFNVMANILIFGQHNIFSFIEATEEEKRNTIEELMNLKDFNEFESRGKELLKNLKKTIEQLEKDNLIIKQEYSDKLSLLDQNVAKLENYKLTILDQIKQLENDLTQIPDVDALKADWDNYNKQQQAIDKLNLDIKRFDSEINEVISSINKINEDKNSLISQLDSKINLDRQKLDNSISSAKSEKIVIESNLASIRDSKNKFLTDKKELISKRESDKRAILPSKNWDGELNSIVTSANDKKMSIADLQKFETSTDIICPTCFGKVDKNNVKSVIAKYEQQLEEERSKWAAMNVAMKKELYELDIKKKEIDDSYDILILSVDGKIGILDEEILSSNPENDLIDKKISQLSNELKSLLDSYKVQKDSIVAKIQNDIDNQMTVKKTIETNKKAIVDQISSLNIKAPSITLEQAATLSSKKDNTIGKISALNNDLDKNPYKEFVSSLEQMISDIKNRYESSCKELVDNQNILPYYDTIVDIFGKEGIKKFAVARIIPSLNEQINYWLQFLYDGNIELNFDELFVPTVKNIGSDREMEFSLSSGGEVRRIDIAIMLGFRDIMKQSTGQSLNVMFFDEVAENLDYYGVKKIHSTIMELSKNCHVYVISHNKELQEMFQNQPSLTIEKKDGQASLAA